ncbi:hypothetical protein BDV27DRAFT_140666 [Aspergillus caelatus]|uniref:Cell surface protein Mas1 n=1 Tax=Aspergillus caelatus TaxID=61420 RepID=A0A5N7AMK9_9EURO|nr:uncharacterized protein BDV27DRAFT_140666 [Aspergillus caelatus]KAE8370229.1 hypothetical protein BDV27DRAFT_140666 [Aspergillus caelatus]
MLFIKAITLTGLAVSQVAAHGLITRVKGHNGIDMPGLTIQDGIPRDCPSAACGAQKDTAIIRDAEFGSVKASPLGRTLGGGPVNPAIVINNFVGAGKQKRSRLPASHRRIQDLADATPFGGTIKSIQSTIDDAMAILPGTQSGTVTGKGAKENGMQLYSGKGASTGLPTASPEGVVTMIYHQVNQDGAGPLSAEIDPSSGGTDAKAFKSARVIQNIPGVAGFSTSSTMDYAVKVQVPQGMKCTGTVGAAKNVCIVRVRNNAISGPFGGSAAFTQ